MRTSSRMTQAITRSEVERCRPTRLGEAAAATGKAPQNRLSSFRPRRSSNSEPASPCYNCASLVSRRPRSLLPATALTPALTLRLLQLNDLQAGLADEAPSEWRTLMEASLREGLDGYCEHQALEAYSRDSQRLLHRIPRCWRSGAVRRLVYSVLLGLAGSFAVALAELSFAAPQLCLATLQVGLAVGRA